MCQKPSLIDSFVLSCGIFSEISEFCSVIPLINLNAQENRAGRKYFLPARGLVGNL
jgi:hypothetical protein